MSSSKKVFLITIDDLRRDFLNLEDKVTPFLDEFSKENTTLSNHVSIAPSSPTSFRSMKTSTYPLQYRDYRKLSKERPYLPEILAKEDVETAGFSSNPYISEHFGFDRGYDNFRDYMSHRRGEPEDIKTKLKSKIAEYPSVKRPLKKLRNMLKGPNVPYPESNKIVEDFKDFAESKEGSEPSFFWIHFMEPHSPLIPKKEFYGKYSDTGIKRRNLKEYGEEGKLDSIQLEKEQIRALYKECIMSLDRDLENLVNYIYQKYGEEQSEIIITSDHGELLGEYGEVGHPEELKKELFEVPMITDIDGIENEERITTHLDIMPTVLDLFDIPVLENLEGRSLLDKFERQSTIVEAVDADENGVERVYMTSKIGKLSKEEFVRKEDYFSIKNLDASDEIKKHSQKHSKDWEQE